MGHIVLACRENAIILNQWNKFAYALTRFELDYDLYYEWEGEYIRLFNDICDCGDEPDNYNNISTAS